MRYTYSDEDETGSDALSTRRSTRQSNRSTPAELGAPTVTLSGRQVRSRFGRTYGEPLDTTMNTPTDGVSGDASEASTRLRGGTGGPRRSNRAHNTDQPRASTRRGEYESIDDLDDEDEAASTGDEWGGDDDDIEGKLDDDDEEEEEDEEDEDEAESIASGDEADDPQSLIVQLKYGKDKGHGITQGIEVNRVNGRSSPLNDTATLHSSRPVEPIVSTTTPEAPPTPTERAFATERSSLPQRPAATYSQRTSPPPKHFEPMKSDSAAPQVTNNLYPNVDNSPEVSAHLPTIQHANGNGNVNVNGIHYITSSQNDKQQNHAEQ